ncbi:hypothetical protein ACYOEI_11260 [Singulisphaera rosea]
MAIELGSKNAILRVLACVFVGLAMAGTTYFSAYRSMREASPYEDMHARTFRLMIWLKEALDASLKGEGRYPVKLADLKGEIPGHFERDSAGRFLDPWEHPFE